MAYLHTRSLLQTLSRSLQAGYRHLALRALLLGSWDRPPGMPHLSECLCGVTTEKQCEVGLGRKDVTVPRPGLLWACVTRGGGGGGHLRRHLG